jgi:mono/diheme cytochrome c family protein
MKIRLLFVSFVIIVMFVNVTWGADVAAGKKAYAEKCASCHGANGEGKDTIAKVMKIEFKHLGSKEVQAKSDADLKKIITEGTGKMKPVKDVNAKMADDLVAYIRTLKQ